MKELINYLLQFGHFNQQQIDLVNSKGVFKEIKKEEYFQEAGKIPIMPVMRYFRKNTHSPATSGSRLANLAFNAERRHLSGIYYSDGKVTKSSVDSCNKAYQDELWRSSIELTGIQQVETTIPLT